MNTSALTPVRRKPQSEMTDEELDDFLEGLRLRELDQICSGGEEERQRGEVGSRCTDSDCFCDTDRCCRVDGLSCKFCEVSS